MSLALAIKKNAISLAQAQKTYKQNVVAVNTLVVGVLESNLPKSLAQKPPDWDEFVATYKDARAEALYWVDTVMARLLDIPKDIRHDNTLISPFLQDAKKQAETLVDDPHNPVASEFLDQDFSSLLCQLTTVFKFIDGAVTKVKNFKNKLPKMAVLLLTIAQKSTAYAKADKKQIAKLNDDIENLRSDIEDLAGEIADLAIFEGTALTFGLVKTIAWPVGLVAWLFFAPTVSAAHKVINLNTEKIKADKKKIEDKESELTGITADVATLYLLATNYAKMAGQTEKVEGNLQAVLNEWRNLQSDVDAAITDIYLATKFKKGAYFSEVLDDINNAIEEWDTACTQAGRLEIGMQVNSAPLEVGMSSSQVQEALAAEQPIAIIKYYKQLMKAA